MARKKHAETKGKAVCRRKRNMARMQTILNMIGLGFLIRIVMATSL
jgi:hypothetical protein